MLQASGELNREMGGPGVRPEINMRVAMQPRHIMGSVAPAYQPSPERAQRHRRTIYAFRRRGMSNPMLKVFNRPDSEQSCARRAETTVPTQVFSLFNSSFAHDRALAFADRLMKQADDSEARLNLAFKLAYGRTPTATERQQCRAHLDAMLEHHRSRSPQPTALPKTVKREMVEELTGKPFTWEEELDIFAGDYERDLKPWQVGAKTRAWKELALVLFNSNEFLYVD